MRQWVVLKANNQLVRGFKVKKNTKEMQCPGRCNVPTIWERDWDFTGEGAKAIWVCRCCQMEVKRKVSKRRTKAVQEFAKSLSI